MGAPALQILPKQLSDYSVAPPHDVVAAKVRSIREEPKALAHNRVPTLGFGKKLKKK